MVELLVKMELGKNSKEVHEKQNLGKKYWNMGDLHFWSGLMKVKGCFLGVTFL
jgi:hypothetical protein